MEKMRNVRQLRRTFLVLNTLFVLSVFRENRWTKSALLFWLLANSLVLLRDSSPNSRHIDCIFFVFCIKVSRFLPENMLK